LQKLPTIIYASFRGDAITRRSDTKEIDMEIHWHGRGRRKIREMERPVSSECECVRSIEPREGSYREDERSASEATPAIPRHAVRLQHLRELDFGFGNFQLITNWPASER